MRYPAPPLPATRVRTNLFRDQPLPRLVYLRARYLHLRATDPASAVYADAALAELESRIAAHAVIAGVAA